MLIIDIESIIKEYLNVPRHAIKLGWEDHSVTIGDYNMEYYVIPLDANGETIERIRERVDTTKKWTPFEFDGDMYLIIEGF